ncbi:aminodeoxychorismate synthase component I [Amphritea sp. 1_MG-2023]|uniref:aminodeoxychorismate synthase component I n=1 Tax=Amphritea sp. 1_MG-2023 TaxID=3062670 RepID=UPI0026E3CFD2|nr:aminodeoxychorismate synthase component I [Amphritea sp. 1_MG-2023]MDO6562161.1 aminodeoxychorismate synthase component I [Amphritea sp. 1_MG-2023]
MYRTFPLPYLPSSIPYFERIRHLPAPVFLDSGKPASLYGQYDILSADPAAQLSYQNRVTRIRHPASEEQLDGNPFTHLQALFNRYQASCPAPQQSDIKALPFCGGILGYFAYDLGRSLETLPEQTHCDIDLPDMQVGIYSWAVIVNHQHQTAVLLTTPLIDEIQARTILQQLTQDTTELADDFTLSHHFESNMSKADYYASLERINDYIHSGDCYQVNFAQRFSSQYKGDPWHAYKRLREHAPTPYSAYIETANGAILSHSPEQFLEVRDARVTTKPIKGTRPRGNNPALDAQLKLALHDSEKDRAENLMIVDLMRNDISKVCAHGSVRVPKLFAVESYANVHHLVSTITGKLRPDKSPIELLEHSFPGGSITGAPKIRAMEIIEELEPNRRSVYCGSIGYLSFSGQIDTSITIRTLICQNGDIHCWAGGGIVADSEVSEEYQETYDKVNNLLSPLEETIIQQ